MAISEYDAFGPWIYEINENYPIPSIFAPFCPAEPSALLQLKIPREIERRRVTPDMDLYDYLLSAYPSHLLLLERKGSSVQKTEVFYHEIQAIQIFREFLKGLLILHLQERTIVVPFNTVSMELMLRLVNLLRERYTTGQNCIGAAVSAPLDAPLSDILFVNLLKDLRRQGETLTGGAWQPTIPLLYCGGNLLEKFRHTIRKPLLQGALHLSTPTELLIIEHEKQTQKNSKRSYGYNYTYVPWNNLTAVHITPDSEHQNMSALRLLLSHDALFFRFSQENRALFAFYEKISDALSHTE